MALNRAVYSAMLELGSRATAVAVPVGDSKLVAKVKADEPSGMVFGTGCERMALKETAPICLPQSLLVRNWM